MGTGRKVKGEARRSFGMGIRYRSVLEGVVDYVPHDSSLMEKGEAGAETITLVWRGVRAGEGSWRALFEGFG